MKPILYIIMRDDLKWSLNPGKAMAQASHASSQFVKLMESKSKVTTELSKAYKQWVNEGEGFGTTIVLSCVNEHQGHNLINYFKNSMKGKIKDITYPLMFPKEMITFLDKEKCNLYYDINTEVDEKGLIPVTITTETCYWLFLYDEEQVEEFKKLCFNIGVELAK